MRLPGPLTADQEKQLKTVQLSARHLLSLINDLLDPAKIESGKVQLNFEPLVCQAIINEIATTLKPLAEAKGLRLITKLPQGDVVVKADRRALSQIIINLANNAIKFTDRGEVSIEVERQQTNGSARTEITVADTGIGIREEEQARLFEAFSQMDASHSRRQEGTGLGLHVSQKLAGLLGAHIHFHSEYGNGSQFIVGLQEK
jgi:protein-histidine pros-kinase